MVVGRFRAHPTTRCWILDAGCWMLDAGSAHPSGDEGVWGEGLPDAGSTQPPSSQSRSQKTQSRKDTKTKRFPRTAVHRRKEAHRSPRSTQNPLNLGKKPTDHAAGIHHRHYDQTSEIASPCHSDRARVASEWRNLWGGYRNIVVCSLAPWISRLGLRLRSK